MSKKINYAFKIDGDFDSVNYYRSETPINTEAMPAAAAAGITSLAYTDLTAAPDKYYYVRFGAVKNSIEKISSEIIVRTSDVAFKASVSAPNTNISQLLTFNLPASVKNGDRLIAAITCRSDREFMVPAGWDALKVFNAGGLAASDSVIKCYLLSKLYSGESSVSFEHSAAAACQGVLNIVAGDIIAIHENLSLLSANITKQKASNGLLKIIIANGFGGSAFDIDISLSNLRQLNGFAGMAESYYSTSPDDGLYFYYMQSASLLDGSHAADISQEPLRNSQGAAVARSLLILEIA
ncbi:hypothetical protein BEN74_03890 [Acinetobacter sp. WCHAc010034]|uniref:hypothetical protein n=1 Tax=Acinetobacter sp. WCHAc010034 TaxID=1879049 RepID=UPI00083A8833|nr:hypothetical protein [Acinetobacter sp. WCHAc010034]AYA02092.1 hypothetical protein BEN74_03890 [Acinetobacter sp. WCHAc010034]